MNAFDAQLVLIAQLQRDPECKRVLGTKHLSDGHFLVLFETTKSFPRFAIGELDAALHPVACCIHERQFSTEANALEVWQSIP